MKDWLDKLAAEQLPTKIPAGHYTTEQVAKRLGITQDAARRMLGRAKAQRVKIKIEGCIKLAYKM